MMKRQRSRATARVRFPGLSQRSSKRASLGGAAARQQRLVQSARRRRVRARRRLRPSARQRTRLRKRKRARAKNSFFNLKFEISDFRYFKLSRFEISIQQEILVI